MAVIMNVHVRCCHCNRYGEGCSGQHCCADCQAMGHVPVFFQQLLWHETGLAARLLSITKAGQRLVDASVLTAELGCMQVWQVAAGMAALSHLSQGGAQMGLCSAGMPVSGSLHVHTYLCSLFSMWYCFGGAAGRRWLSTCHLLVCACCTFGSHRSYIAAMFVLAVA